MERHDETGAQAARDVADDRTDATDERTDERTDARDARTEHEGAARAGNAGHDGPAQSEQTDEGFETGYDQERDTAEEQLEPNFARGIADEDAPGADHKGRFSEGQEELPESPEKNVERRFSEGTERSPTSD